MSLEITSNKPTLKSGETAILTFTFTNTPTDFAVEDIKVSGGKISKFTLVTGSKGKIFTAEFTPAENNNSLKSVISVADGSYSDNTGNGSGSRLVLTGDTAAPTVLITSDIDNLKLGEKTQLTFTFSEAVKEFVATDIKVSGGTLANFKAIDKSARIFTADFTREAGADSTVSIEQGSYSDKAGNAGAESNLLALSKDTTKPTVEITSDKTEFKVGETANLTFTFSELPKDFALEDITVSGGKISDLLATSNSKVYSAVFTPDADSNKLAGAVSVAADRFEDASENKNLASNTLLMSGDTKAPSVTISSQLAQLKVGQKTQVTFKFSEALAENSFDSKDVKVTRNSQIWCTADLNQATICCVCSVISGSMMTAIPS